MSVHHICVRFTVRRGTRAVRKLAPVLHDELHGAQRWPYSHRTRPNRQERQEHWHRMLDSADDGHCGSIPQAARLGNMRRHSPFSTARGLLESASPTDCHAAMWNSQTPSCDIHKHHLLRTPRSNRKGSRCPDVSPRGIATPTQWHDEARPCNSCRPCLHANTATNFVEPPTCLHTSPANVRSC